VPVHAGQSLGKYVDECAVRPQWARSHRFMPGDGTCDVVVDVVPRGQQDRYDYRRTGAVQYLGQAGTLHVLVDVCLDNVEPGPRGGHRRAKRSDGSTPGRAARPMSCRDERWIVGHVRDRTRWRGGDNFARDDMTFDDAAIQASLTRYSPSAQLAC
jgi:hypothetical protein